MTPQQIEQLSAALYRNLTNTGFVRVNYRHDDEIIAKFDKAVKEALNEFEAMQAPEYIAKQEAVKANWEEHEITVGNANRYLKRNDFGVKYDSGSDKTFVDLK